MGSSPLHPGFPRHNAGGVRLGGGTLMCLLFCNTKSKQKHKHTGKFRCICSSTICPQAHTLQGSGSLRWFPFLIQKMQQNKPPCRLWRAITKERFQKHSEMMSPEWMGHLPRSWREQALLDYTAFTLLSNQRQNRLFSYSFSGGRYFGRAVPGPPLLGGPGTSNIPSTPVSPNPLCTHDLVPTPPQPFMGFFFCQFHCFLFCISLIFYFFLMTIIYNMQYLY